MIALSQKQPISRFVALVFVGTALFMPCRIAFAAEAAPKATAAEEKLLREVFPQAGSFSGKDGAKPHYKAFVKNAKTGKSDLAGFVFKTYEVEPDEYGYAGPIEIIVGMTKDGVITGIKVLNHREPFGSFSIDPPEFAAQFKGKSILDAFEVGNDIDAVTRATISVDGASRVIRKSARRVLQQHLAEQQGKK